MIDEAFDAAWDRRQALHDDPGTDVYRLMDGRHEGAPGWTVDRYGSVGFLRRFGSGRGDPGALAEAVLRRLDAVVIDEPRSDRRVAGSMPDPVAGGRPGSLVVTEGGLRYCVELLWGHNPGLFLDTRPLRAHVRATTDGLRVLNLFAYTCSFGVAAMAGGARSTTNVDLVGTALARGRDNYRLGGFEPDSRTFLKSEVFDFAKRALRRHERWDLVIADPPPTRTRGRSRGWDPSRDMARLIAVARRLTADGGRLLLISAVRGRDRFEDLLPEGDWTRWKAGEDFPDAEGGLRGWEGRLESLAP